MSKVSQPEIDLASAAFELAAHDQSLEMLVTIAPVAGVVVTFLTGSALVSGKASTRIRWGAHLDEVFKKSLAGDFRQRLIDAGYEAKDAAHLIEVFETPSFDQRATDSYKWRAEHTQKINDLGEDVDLTEIDAPELVRDAIVESIHTPVVTLLDAKVRIGSSTFYLPLRRVFT